MIKNISRYVFTLLASVGIMYISVSHVTLMLVSKFFKGFQQNIAYYRSISFFFVRE